MPGLDPKSGAELRGALFLCKVIQIHQESSKALKICLLVHEQFTFWPFGVMVPCILYADLLLEQIIPVSMMRALVEMRGQDSLFLFLSTSPWYTPIIFAFDPDHSLLWLIFWLTRPTNQNRPIAKILHFYVFYLIWIQFGSNLDPIWYGANIGQKTI